MTGLRASGKTVLLTDICEWIGRMKNWLVIKISPLDDILEALYSDLQNSRYFNPDNYEASYGLSLFGASVTVNHQRPELNLVDAIDKTLAAFQKQGIKVLVAIDEATNTPQMQRFASAFQLFISNNRPLYFLATGLYDEIMSLQDVKNLTFLYWSPKIVLAPLNQMAVANAYSRIFKLDQDQSIKMAKLTRGYPFAFQTLGYVCWEQGTCEIGGDTLQEYDQLLADASYAKLWSELSELDQRVLSVIAENEGGKVKEFRERLQMNPNLFNQYRRRLKNQGLIDARQYGTISFALPRFAEFVRFETY
ncbi:MAG: ATP-binding protein [Lactobacillus delbrueckii]|nr:ATP-binding protein [Lactobacillus delbrueckii]MCI1948818.1 ATP-binding protein [Lactobacillus delbrueckii]